MISSQTAKDIESAIVFLVNTITTSGKNPKPVILHSILVGVSLAKLNYSRDIIVAGILHDTVEDSDATLTQIRDQFGESVARIVDACTYDFSIEDKVEQYTKAIIRATAMSWESLIVMAADFIENEPYYNQEDFTQYPRDKIAYFISYAEPFIKDEPIWSELNFIRQKYKGQL